jgi:hypothetical protein
LATLPSAPQDCGATPTEWRPNLGKPVSSITHAAGAMATVGAPFDVGISPHRYTQQPRHRKT